MLTTLLLLVMLTLIFLRKNPRRLYLENIFTLFGLRQVITAPSRVTDLSSALIDAIAVSGMLHVVSQKSVDLLNVSDHLLIRCSHALMSPKRHQLLSLIETFPTSLLKSLQVMRNL